MTAIGSPLYDVAATHAAALWALVALPLLAWLLAAVAERPVVARSVAGRLVDGYRSSSLTDRATLWLLAASAAIHLGLALDGTHGGAGLRLAFIVQAVLLALSAGRMLTGRSWHRLAVTTLGGSVVAYWLALLTGTAPDQIGLATKLGEIAAIALIVTSAGGRRWRARLAPAALVALVVLTDVMAWVGAVAVSGGADVGGHDLGHSAAPAPGTLVVPPPDREPTGSERDAADALLEAVRAGIAPYADPTVAAAAGFEVDGIAGAEFHAGNPAFEADGRILDPGRPEALVYATDPSGRPALIGALFLMPSMFEPGPTIGGPLTVWHAHEHICFGLLPPALTGVLSPLGACPVGSIDVPRSAEMIHVWTLPGNPQPFGELDQDGLAAYLASRVEP